MVIALDTNVFIYYFERHPEFGPAAKLTLAKLSKPGTKGVTSIVSLLELLSLPQGSKILDDLKSRYLRIPNLTTSDVSQEIALEAARIRRTYGYRTSDAIQLATALTHKADLFITNDIRLKKFPELKIHLLSI